MYEIPTKINIGGTEYQIRNKGDYRMVLDCFSALQDASLNSNERLFCSLIIFYEDINSIADVNNIENLEEAITKMFDFFNCGRAQSVGKQMNYKLIDWEKDSQMICSAIIQKFVQNPIYTGGHLWATILLLVNRFCQVSFQYEIK